jgi:thermostable 8-oxoguanine DNA glycosylase
MKTAVEQIINEFNQELDVAISIANNDKIKTIKHLINIANKYLEMEKEQIKRAFIQGEYNFYLKNAEQYYNETFKSE